MVQLNKDEIIKITKRLQSVRQGLVQKAPFYAILLFGLRFSLDDMVERVYTDGERIAFNPDFLKEISDSELEFIMLHEVSHVALGHPFRCVNDYDIEIFDEACDIVVNSNIYHYMGDDESFIAIKGLGVMPHKNYNGEEGYKFTVEQVYEHLFKIKGKKKKNDNGTTPDFADIIDNELEDDLETLEEGVNSSNDENLDNESESDDNEISKSQKLKKSKDNTNTDSNTEGEGAVGDESGGEDVGDADGSGTGKGQAKGKGNGAGKAKGNGASKNGSLGSSGLSKGSGRVSGKGFTKGLENRKQAQIKDSKIRPVIRFDDHSFWKGEDRQDINKAVWESRVLQTYEAVKNIKRISIKGKGRSWGSSPLFAERIYQEIAERKLDWKTLLNDFVQEEVCDYSFSPPDRRFGDSEFFLPDFNEKEESVENLLFMIDTSASMSDSAISEVYSEIKGAIEQFNGKIKGWLGFFDASVVEPKPFEDEGEFKAIRIQGGGGTAFLPIFTYVRDNMQNEKITSIIILTDGYAPFPQEKERMDIPVLWIINNEEVTPPWGMVARIIQKSNQNDM